MPVEPHPEGENPHPDHDRLPGKFPSHFPDIGAHDPEAPGAERRFQGVDPILRIGAETPLEHGQGSKEGKGEDADQKGRSRYFIEHSKILFYLRDLSAATGDT